MNDIVDLRTVLRPPESDAQAERTPAVSLVRLLDRHGVAMAAVLSSSALHHEAVGGNAETLVACRDEPRLHPIFVLDPREPGPAPAIDGARLLALFPATHGYPGVYAPLRRMLRALQAAPTAPPILVEAHRAGDATALASQLGEAGYRGPVILSGISGAVTLAEALAVAEESPQILVATDGLHGLGEIGAVVHALGAHRVVFASGTPEGSLGAALALVRHAHLSPDDEALVLGGNARRLLGIGTPAAGSLAA